MALLTLVHSPTSGREPGTNPSVVAETLFDLADQIRSRQNAGR
jgi:hypothetical protein